MFCIPIIARNTDEALKKIARAELLADILEIRLDMMDAFDLPEIIQSTAKPILVTYRSEKEGGRGAANYMTRVHYLSKAIEAGAGFVDVEHSLPLDYRLKLFQMRGSSKLILSKHILNGTPSREKLEDVLKKMAATGADIVKIVTRAGSWENNFRILELIQRAHDQKIKIITFCMGPMGKMSRVFSCLMGGYLTFVSLEAGEESADGQIPVREMKKILECFSL